MQHSPFAAEQSDSTKTWHPDPKVQSQQTHHSERCLAPSVPCDRLLSGWSYEHVKRIFRNPWDLFHWAGRKQEASAMFLMLFSYRPLRVFKKVRYVVQFHNPDDEFDCDRRDPWMGLGGSGLGETEPIRSICRKFWEQRDELARGEHEGIIQTKYNRFLDSRFTRITVTSILWYSTTTCWQLHHLYGN